MIQFNEIAIFCVLDDAGGTMSLMQGKLLPRIAGPLSTLQLREVLARIAYCSYLIKERPEFHTSFVNGEFQISRSMSEYVETNSEDPGLLGALMHKLCAPIIGPRKFFSVKVADDFF
jgi:hypothetical protein